jgi:hypothetical protein
MTTTTLRLPDGAVYVTREQEREQPVSKSAVTPSQQRELAHLGATVAQEAVARNVSGPRSNPKPPAWRRPRSTLGLATRT